MQRLVNVRQYICLLTNTYLAPTRLNTVSCTRLGAQASAPDEQQTRKDKLEYNVQATISVLYHIIR